MRIYRLLYLVSLVFVLYFMNVDIYEYNFKSKILK